MGNDNASVNVGGQRIPLVGVPEEPKTGPTPTPGYDPNSPTPYTPPAEPAPAQVTPPPQFADTMGRPQTRPEFGGGGKAVAGTIAYLGDSIMRGAIAGRQMAQQAKAIKQDRLLRGLARVNQQAANHVLDIAQRPDISPILEKMRQNPKYQPTPEEQKTLEPYQQALEASNAAWQAYNTAQNNYLFGDQFGGKKAKKGKGGAAGQPQDPMALWTSQDPHEKLQGAALMRTKFGNPVMFQVNDMLAQMASKGPALAHQSYLENLQNEFDGLQRQIATLSAIPEEQRTDAQKQQLAQSQERFRVIQRQMEEQKLLTTKQTGAGFTPHAATVLLTDGKTVAATRQYDPGSQTYRYLDTATGADITDRVQREVTTATIPSMKVVKGGVQMPDGTIYSAGANLQMSDAPPEVRQFWMGHIAEAFKGKTTETVTDEHGNVFQRSQFSPGSLPGGGGAAPAGAPAAKPGETPTHRAASAGGESRPPSKPFSRPDQPAPHPHLTKYDQQRLDANYKETVTELDKVAAPITQLSGRLANLHDAVYDKNPQADALIAPELLSVMVTGGTSGSGLRMNEAEIERIVGGRTNWLAIKAAANRWALNPEEGLQIPDDQRAMILKLLEGFGEKNVMNGIERRLRIKEKVISSAYQNLAKADSVDQQRQIYADVRTAMTAIDQNKVLTPDIVKRAAKEHGVSYEKAYQQAVSQGYYVTDVR